MLIRTRPFNPAFDRRVARIPLSFTPPRRTPVVNAAWTDGTLELSVDLPGTPAEAVDVSVTDRILTIAVTTPELSWRRSIRLGATLDPEQVVAEHVDGRLTVRVSPTATPEPRRIEVVTTAPAQPQNGTSDNE